MIELLVVVAIIAILAALLMPSLKQAREQARRTACLSNLRQIALVVNQYANDWEGRIPPTWSSTPGAFSIIYLTRSAGPVNEAWGYAISAYLNDERIWYCANGKPTTTGFRPTQGKPVFTDFAAKTPGYIEIGYFLLVGHLPPGWGGMGTELKPVSIDEAARVRNPILADVTYRDDYPSTVAKTNHRAGAAAGANALYADGHARWWNVAQMTNVLNGQIVPLAD